MKKLISGSLIALSLITNLNAAETSNSEVKATVNKECINMSVASVVNFGSNINPLVEQTNDYSFAEAGTLAKTLHVLWTCSRGTQLEIHQTSANSWNLKTSDGESIPYNYYNSEEVSYDAGNTNNTETKTGTGSEVDNHWRLKLPIDNQTKPGHYTDIITTTFTW